MNILNIIQLDHIQSMIYDNNLNLVLQWTCHIHYNQAIILICYFKKEIYLYKHALHKENSYNLTISHPKVKIYEINVNMIPIKLSFDII